MSTFFTSDHHFGHEKIIGYCARPFGSLDEMHDAMIERWNAVVAPEDHVYHLGDFAFGNAEMVERFRHRLHGHVTLVQGNHDRVGRGSLRRIFDDVVDDMTLHMDGHIIHLVHRPIQAHRADIVLCGHMHEKWRFQGKAINVGVDQWEFTPRTLKELLVGRPAQT